MKPDAKSLKPLYAVLDAQDRRQALGIYSICSSHPSVIEAAVRHAARFQLPLLVESTCNQVNQEGGYTGLTPERFAGRVDQVRRRHSLPAPNLILGGDHLGPSPWQSEPAEAAMAKAKALVSSCVRAGYRKIHLDASMRLSGDDPTRPLPLEASATRTGELCQVAEAAFESSGRKAPAPCYVIGSEVPTPGGATVATERPQVTSVDDLRSTLEATERAFRQRDLGQAWERVLAVVVQPGIEYGDEGVFHYDRAQAQNLKRLIEDHRGLVYEAHSTDYQRPQALADLVEDHFAILKVGPWLTFAYREAIFALSYIEEELLGPQWEGQGSRLREVLEAEMLAHPEQWEDHYTGSPQDLRVARAHSLSDRIRYYWARPRVREAVKVLLHNLEQRPVPLSLLSQFLPRQYELIQSSRLKNEPSELIYSKIETVLTDYAEACRLI